MTTAKTTSSIIAAAAENFDEFGFDSAADYIADQIDGLWEKKTSLQHAIRDAVSFVEISKAAERKAEIAAIEADIDLHRQALAACPRD